MYCRKANDLLALERDGSLEAVARAELEAHLATCSTCQRARSDVAAAIESWRAEAAAVNVPSADREWQALRRRIRGGVSADATAGAPARRLNFAWLALPLTAALVALVLLLPSRRASVPGPNLGATAVARADAVEAPGGNASTMVFVDDRSGWLIVWASDAGGKSG